MPDNSPRPRIVIAEDHGGLLEKVAGLLQREFDVVAKVTDGKSALQCAIELEPHVLLLDLYIPEMNGLEVVRALKKLNTRTAPVIMSGSEDLEIAEAAVAAGAALFVGKSRLLSELIPVMRQAAQRAGSSR